MNNTKYKYILYTIVIVIITTIAIQVYWNYKNYLVNKQQLINDVQVSLDNAVANYYEDLAKNSTFGFAYSSTNKNTSANVVFDSIFNTIQIDTTNRVFSNIDSIDVKSIKDIRIFSGIKTDSLLKDFEGSHKKWSIDSKNNITIKNKFLADSVLEDDVKRLTSQVLISFKNDTLNLSKIDSLLFNEFSRKSINIDHGLTFKETYNDTIYHNKTIVNKASLFTSSKSNFLPHNGVLSVHFSNETKVILKRILSGILISTLLILAVISCLFYLLKIIKHQKQLAEVRNDFISNITHEFKTPIATIGVALESIKDFNIIDDKEKTKTYLDLSNRQLSKLNIMVEKLLETATLDSENLSLNKELTNIIDLVTLLVNKHQLQCDSKTIHFESTSEIVMAQIDVFHFENVINNIIDNAIKYGGNLISVHVSQTLSEFTIIISDDGQSLTKIDQERIFEKFYRIPKGNTHDVKGFGIGLYYSKKIIEKHGGTLDLNLKNSLTTFKITLPNE